MLPENFQKLQYEYKEIFKTEISKVSSMGCCTCLDNDNHDSDKSKCLEFYKTNSYYSRLERYDLGLEKLKKSIGVLVGTGTISHTSYSSKYPILNLSLPDDAYETLTGFASGKPIILSKNENMPHRQKFKDLFQAVGRISGLLSHGNHTIFLLEYRLPESYEMISKYDIVLHILAFLSEVTRIKSKNNDSGGICKIRWQN
jgi:hypothetical protein